MAKSNSNSISDRKSDGDITSKDHKKFEEDKLKQKKEQDKKQKEKHLKDKKRINTIISFPFKALFQVSAVVSIIYFGTQFFSHTDDLIKLIINSLFNAFVVFAAIYLGVGLLMMLVFFIWAEQRRAEADERRKKEEERRKEEEQEKMKEQNLLEEELRQNELRRKEELLRFKRSQETNQNFNTGMNESQNINEPLFDNNLSNLEQNNINES